MRNQNIDELLARYRQTRDPRDIAEIFDLCAGSLFATAIHLLGDAGEAEDAIQDTFLALIKSVSRYDPARPAMPFIVGVLQRQALYRARRNRRSPDRRRLARPASPTPTEAAETTEMGVALREAISRLPEAYRRVIGSVLEDSLGPAEIAHRLGESPGAIRTRIHRGLEMLRGKLPAGFALPAILLAMEGRTLAAVRTVVVEEAARVAVTGSAETATFAINALWSGVGAKAAAAVAVALLAGVGAAGVQAVGEGGCALPPAAIGGARGVLPAQGALESAGLPVDEDGQESGEGVVARPRRGVPVVSRLTAIRRGEFRFRWGQGYSFAKDALVAPRDADVVFGRDKGNTTTRLIIRAGCANLQIFDQQIDGVPCTLDCYMRSVVSLDEGEVSWQSELDVEPMKFLTRAFVMRTRSGGFAVCVVERGGDEDPRDGAVYGVKYVYNPRAPAFVDGEHETTDIGGVRFDMTAFLTDPMMSEYIAEYELRRDLLGAELETLDQTADRLAVAMGVSQTEKAGVAAVLSLESAEEIMDDARVRARQRLNQAFKASSYSFEWATRDDVGATGNDWDLFVTGASRGDLSFHVNHSGHDRGQVWALGPVVFGDIGTWSSAEVVRVDRDHPLDRRVKVVGGGGYLVRTLDVGSDHWTALKVLATTDGGGVVFRWKKLDETGLLEQAARATYNVLIDPVVRVQMRTGDGNGQFNRIYIDGTKNEYLGQVSALPIDLSVHPAPEDGSVAFIESGLVPDKKMWVVTSIDYDAPGSDDDEGLCNFAVVFKGQSLITAEITDATLRDRWTGRVEVRRGDEARFYVEMQHAGRCSVTIGGHFEDALVGR